MRKTILLFLFLVGSLGTLFAQPQILISTFISGGAATGAVSPTFPSFFGSIGQPMVLPRNVKFDNGAGVMVGANSMFGGGAADPIPPTITFDTTPIVNPATLTTINVTMTDDIGLAAERIYYRPILGGTFTQLDMTHGTGSTYSASLPITDPMGVEFYFKAFDAQNVTTSVNKFAYTSYANPQVTPTLMKYGKTASDYRIISVPFDLTGNANAVFTDLPGVDKTKYRLWQFEGGNWTEFSEFQTIDRGKGYFIILDVTEVLLKLPTNIKAPSNNRSALFTMPLTTEWNLIGNPYPVVINWDSVMVLNGSPASVGADLKKYSSSGYQNSRTLQPYEGAFVRVTGTPPSNFQIGLGTQNTPGGRIANVVSYDLAAPEWEVPFTLKQGEVQNTMAGIGMKPQASLGLDRFDDYSPPHVFDYVDMISQRPDLKVNDLTKDVVNTQGSYIWRFEATAGSGEEVELSWDNTRFGNNTIPLYLYDIGNNEVIDMRETGVIRFSPDVSKQFKIYYGIDKKEISPDELMTKAPFPNPFVQATEFGFALPGVNDSFEVDLELLNSMGQRVKTLTKGTYLSGRYFVQWNGSGDDGEKVAGGVYFYKLAIDGKQSRMFNGRVIFTH